MNSLRTAAITGWIAISFAVFTGSAEAENLWLNSQLFGPSQPSRLSAEPAATVLWSPLASHFTDTDGDHLPDRYDPDVDGDGIPNYRDPEPYQAQSPPVVFSFFYAPAQGTLSCDGVEKPTTQPTPCAVGQSGLTISRTDWDGKEAHLAENGDVSGDCAGSVSADPNVAGAYQLTPTCITPPPPPPEARKDATGDPPLVDEWFTDLPWHQKLSTLDSNLIDVPFVMPFKALPADTCPSATTETEQARCMLRYGIVDVMAIHRTDRLYRPGEAPTRQGQDCDNGDCVEVKIEVQRLHTLTDDPKGYAADVVRNDPHKGDPPTYPPDPPPADPAVPSLGFAITEATIFAPWEPWYLGHYCGKDRADYIDSVCYDDYFTTQLVAAADEQGNERWLDPSLSVYSSYPAIFFPQGGEHQPFRKFCQTGTDACSMVLGKVDWRAEATEPPVVGCAKNDRNNQDPVSQCQDEVNAKTARLETQFNDALHEFADQGRYPWGETYKSPAELASAIPSTPFIGYYDLTRYSESGGGKIPSSLFKAPRYVLPKECSQRDFSAARHGDSDAVGRLKDCALDFEVHTSGYHEIWKELYGGDANNINVPEISNVLVGSAANQYGRTMFMFAGIPEQKLPVSFKLLDDGMSIYDKVYGASLFTQYLPMVNPADQTSATRSYANNFWHAFFMSNHMNQTPDHFIRGIRGRTLWHNEYRSNIMYQAVKDGKDVGTTYEGVLDHVDFPAGFQEPDHKVPYHGNTCDACHIRNGSGIPLMPNGKLPQITVDKGMKADFQINGRDYTYTNEELPSMKVVLFDLKAPSERLERCDANDDTAIEPSGLNGDHYYMNKIMNFYGNSLHVNQDVTQEGPRPTYSMKYTPITNDTTVKRFEVVDPTPRQPQGRAEAYKPMRVSIYDIKTGDCEKSRDIVPNPGVAAERWPSDCTDTDGDAISKAIADGDIGFMHLLGRRLGNTPLIEMIPNQAIVDAQRAQRNDPDFMYPGCFALAAGTRVGTDGNLNYRNCENKERADCYISRWGWIGDRASLEDQIANAAIMEMNITSKTGAAAIAAIDPRADEPSRQVRYDKPVCGPADLKCLNSKNEGEGNSDLEEQEIEDMATYQRWIGIPQRSEYQVSSDIVQRGEEQFNQLGCSICHVIRKIPFVEGDNMLPDEERKNLSRLQEGFRGASRFGGDARLPDGEGRSLLTRLLSTVGERDYPFVSYLGTDLLLHDMGYLSQVAESPAGESIRNSDGTVKWAYKGYIQRIRTPALKGLRFNRFVTDSNHNSTKPLGKDVPANEVVSGCDFLLHDGRACDAIEAAYLHDGPAVKKLHMIEELNSRSSEQIRDLRAFLYSL